MAQFYFLSIITNALGGFTLFTARGGEKAGGTLGILANETFRLILGIAAAAVGVLKILSPAAGDVLIVGDLIPALLGFCTGFALIFTYYRSRSSLESEGAEKLESLIAVNQRWVGIAAMVSAALHFLFPSVLLL
jgi:hypothetical protein